VSDADLFRGLTVLSLEQALTLPFLTYRLRQEGMEVVRIEHPRKCDPNRFIGKNVLGEEAMNAYFLQNNLGKRALTLNLKESDGQELLGRLLVELDVDIFATNQLPRSYAGLGIDCERLRKIKPDLIWLGITGWGPDISEAAYDPVVQARAGVMELTGDPAGPPTVLGVALADLGASEHAFGQIMKALWKKDRTGRGSRIDISMFDSTTSWVSGSVMFALSFGEYHTRRGNTHEFFAPVSVFRTGDGHIYIAVGNDQQWGRLISLPAFAHLDRKEYRRNAGRIADVGKLEAELAKVLETRPSAHWMAAFGDIGLPVSRVNTMRDLAEEPLLRAQTIRATDPRSGRKVELPAAPVKTAYLESRDFELEFPPRLGEHNGEVYGGVLGLSGEEMASLRERGVI
jgi:formyl-CoA transferase